LSALNDLRPAGGTTAWHVKSDDLHAVDSTQARCKLGA
jgi:hypothetical protein